MQIALSKSKNFPSMQKSLRTIFASSLIFLCKDDKASVSASFTRANYQFCDIARVSLAYWKNFFEKLGFYKNKKTELLIHKIWTIVPNANKF